MQHNEELQSGKLAERKREQKEAAAAADAAAAEEVDAFANRVFVVGAEQGIEFGAGDGLDARSFGC